MQRAQEHVLRDVEAEQRQITTQISTIKEQGNLKINEMQKIQADQESFDTQLGQQMNFMRKHFPELAEGWEWVQEHQADFEKPVFGPPMISCSVKDERYSDQIQALLMNDDLACFTAQTKNDYKKLTNQLYRVMSLSVVVRTCSQPLTSFQPPVSADEATALGLEGFAVDFLDGPDPVISMLCAEKRLHHSGVSLQEHDDAQYHRLVNSGKVSQWAAGKQVFTVRRRREYGPEAMTAITKNIQPGRFWTSQPVDTQEKAEMSRRLMELRGERDALKAELRALQEKNKVFEDQKKDVYDKIVCLTRLSFHPSTDQAIGNPQNGQGPTPERIPEVAVLARENWSVF